MVADILEALVNKEHFEDKVYKGKIDTFEVGSSEPKYMVSLLLQRIYPKNTLRFIYAAKTQMDMLP